MKKLLSLLIVAVMSNCVFAQDIIVTKDSQKIDAKILEVSKSEIKYKEFNYQDGPTFILSTVDIVTIIYANGKVVLYNKEEVTKENVAIAKANAKGALFGESGNASGQKGNPVGHGTGGGNNWSLSGRGLKGTLPQPANTFRQEGKVVVQICVNTIGKVISAAIIGGDISDKQTQQLALDAAKKARFTEGDSDVIGTITYIFKLN